MRCLRAGRLCALPLRRCDANTKQQSKIDASPNQIHGERVPAASRERLPARPLQATAAPEPQAPPTRAGSLGPSSDQVACERALWEYDRLPSNVAPRTTLTEFEDRRVEASEACGRRIAIKREHQQMIDKERARLERIAIDRRHLNDCQRKMNSGLCSRDNRRSDCYDDVGFPC